MKTPTTWCLLTHTGSNFISSPALYGYIIRYSAWYWGNMDRNVRSHGWQSDRELSHIFDTSARRSSLFLAKLALVHGAPDLNCYELKIVTRCWNVQTARDIQSRGNTDNCSALTGFSECLPGSEHNIPSRVSTDTPRFRYYALISRKLLACHGPWIRQESENISCN